MKDSMNSGPAKIKARRLADIVTSVTQNPSGLDVICFALTTLLGLRSVHLTVDRIDIHVYSDDDQGGDHQSDAEPKGGV